MPPAEPPHPALGSWTDDASEPGGPGTASAKLRLMTQQLEDIRSNGGSGSTRVQVDNFDGFDDLAQANQFGTGNPGTQPTFYDLTLDENHRWLSARSALVDPTSDGAYLPPVQIYLKQGTGVYVPAPGDSTSGLKVVAAGYTASVSGTFTRPGDTNAYAAGDAVTDSTSSPNAITFTGCARVSGGTWIITDAILVDNANQTTKGTFELWVFESQPTATNDNSAFAPSLGQLMTCCGIITFSAAYVGSSGAGAAGNTLYPGSGLPISFQCAAGSARLYGLLVVRNAYTPIASESFSFRLRIQQD